MAIVRFLVRSPRGDFTGEGAGTPPLWFRNGEAELAVDLDNWEPGGQRGALFYYKIQGFDLVPLDGVSVDQALRDPSADAAAVQAEIDDLDRQIKAENSRDLLAAKRQELADIRAKRAAEQASADAAGQGGAAATSPAADNLRHDVPPPAPDAAVADWRAYAVEIDPSLDDAAARLLGKVELQSRYGSAFAPGGAQEGTVTA